jgi:multicomponent Na+:H+ antiporter subunit D
MTAVRDLLWLALAIPATGALLIGLAGHRTTLRESMTFLSASLLFTVVLILASTVWGPQDGPDALRLVLAEPLPGLAISLSLEPLGLLFALIASGLWIIKSLY